MIDSLTQTIAKALTNAFPNLIIEIHEYYITIKIDLKPKPNVPGMPKFERKLWLATIKQSNTTITLSILPGPYGDSIGIKYELNDPESLDKLYSAIYQYHKISKEIISKHEITMVPSINEPTDMKLQADIIAETRSIKIPKLTWN